MDKIPNECWKCDYTHEDSNGATVCSMTGETLYPMGVNRVLKECPLTEVLDLPG